MRGKKAVGYGIALVLLTVLWGLAGCGGGSQPQTGGATITVNDGANPLEGAGVTLAGGTQTTDALGQAVFSDVPAGDYTVTAAKSGYADGSASITIVGGATATAAITLAPGGNATITVNDGTDPIEGASVTLAGRTLITNAQGEAAFTGIPVGTYTATASKSGYTENTAEITVTAGATATATISLTKQTGNATITVDDGTDPVSGADVTLNKQTLATNELGVAVFTDLAPGEYAASAVKNGYTSNNAPVTVTAGANSEATISLTRQTGSATITVNVGTNPLSDARVTLAGRTLTTDVSGMAAFANVPTGVYTATAAKDGYHSNTASVTVTDGGTATATITTTRQTGSVSVWVLEDPSYIHLTGASVTMAGRTVTANVDGRYDFTDMPTGTYPATASCAGHATATSNVTVTDDHGLDGECGYGSQIVFLKKFVAGLIIITMFDKNGSPVSGVTVEIWLKSDPSAKKTGTTNASGQVALSNVVAGLWRINASSSQPGYWTPFGQDFTVTATDLAFTFQVPFWPS